MGEDVWTTFNIFLLTVEKLPLVVDAAVEDVVEEELPTTKVLAEPAQLVAICADVSTKLANK